MIIGSNILFFESLPSTNTQAAGLLRNDKLPEGTIIHTHYQTAGRGYYGNSWESENGKNLLISIILYPSFINAGDQFRISMAISLGICDFLTSLIPECSIKWPNDIYVNNDKIAGILIENSISGDRIENTIAGIGLNINQEKFSDAPNPVSLRILTGKSFVLNTCLNQLSKDLDKRYKQLIAGSPDQINIEYNSKLYRLNQWFKFRDSKGIKTGRILSTGEYGRLKIESQDGEQNEYNFKEIEFIP